MIQIIPFEPIHLESLALQDAQSWMSSMVGGGYGETLKQSGPCFTLIDGEKVIVCSGLVNMWENRAQAWALISGDAGRYFVRMFRAMQSFLDLQNIRRIEATVDANFIQGHRLIRMLGFEYEGMMRAYLADGRDCCLYGRVR